MAAAAAEFMELALEQAKFALDNLEVPVGYTPASFHT
jgi:hypothetical protein